MSLFKRNDDTLDQAIAEVAGEPIDPAVVEQAAARVWERLAQGAPVHRLESQPAPVAEAQGSLKGCEDFQALIPAYIRGALSPARALLVEDHTDSREFMQKLLETEGHRVSAAATVQEALDRLASPEGAEFEVLITDIGLPDASGWDLIPKARAARPSLRIGVVTGWEGHNAPSEGADFMLRKPIRTSDFLAEVAGDE